MKQAIFLIAIMAFCTVKSFVDPIWAIVLYYFFAVFRPQAMWEWSLPPGIRWSLYASILAVIALIARWGSVGERAVERWFTLLVALFGLCIFASYCGAINQEVAGNAGWEYAKIIIMLLVASFVVTERRHVRYLAWVILLSLTYLVYQVNSLYVFEGRMDIWSNGYGGLDNNGAGLMLAMAIPFQFFFFQAERRWWRWGFLLCVIPTVHAVMLTYSRGAMLSSIVAGVGMILTTGKHRLQTLALGGFLAIIVLALAGPSVRARFMTIDQSDRDASAQSRYGSWQAGWGIIKDYPLFGAGPRNCNLLSHRYGADMEGRTIHDVYIQIGADCGIPAALLYIGMIICALRWLWRGSRISAPHWEEPEHRWHQCICRASFWSLVTYSFGVIFLSLETVELPYLLMLMGAVAPSLAAKGLPGESKMPKPVPLGDRTPVKV
jgi:probable O-glycosylation ligase (exosortase A-associated)